jgi:hypothetical protein
MTDHFSKLTRTVPLRRISAFTVARAFCEQWVFVYGAPRYVLTENGTQFTAKTSLRYAEKSELERYLPRPTIPRQMGRWRG